VSASVLAVASLFYAEGSERLITRGDHPVRTGLIELDGQAWAAVGSDLGDGPVGSPGHRLQQPLVVKVLVVKVLVGVGRLPLLC
jgi:hypothetical protein